MCIFSFKYERRADSHDKESGSKKENEITYFLFSILFPIPHNEIYTVKIPPAKFTWFQKPDLGSTWYFKY